jgi:hypothetical protein
MAVVERDYSGIRRHPGGRGDRLHGHGLAHQHFPDWLPPGIRRGRSAENESLRGADGLCRDSISGTAVFCHRGERHGSDAALVVTVWVGHEISGTDWLIFRGQTDYRGNLTFADIDGTYYPRSASQDARPGTSSKSKEGPPDQRGLGPQYVWWEWYAGEVDQRHLADPHHTYRLPRPLLIAGRGWRCHWRAAPRPGT